MRRRKCAVLPKISRQGTVTKMVIDRLENLERYASLHPRFPRAFEYLRGLLASGASDGVYQNSSDPRVPRKRFLFHVVPPAAWFMRVRATVCVHAGRGVQKFGGQDTHRNFAVVSRGFSM